MNGVLAEQMIESLARRSPWAADLARFASLAARVDRALLRTLRLRLLRDADAGIEADLWLSPLVEGASSLAFAFQPTVLPELRKQLQNLGKLEAVWKILLERHPHVPPAVRWEERVTYLSLTGAGADEIQTELFQAIATLQQAPDRGVARWAARVAPRLPESAKTTEAARILDFGAAIHLGKQPSLGDPPAQAVGRWLHWVLPSDFRRTEVGVRVGDAAIEFREPPAEGDHKIEAPLTNPIILSVSWENGDRPHQEQVLLSPGHQVRVPTKAARVRLRGGGGFTYDLHIERQTRTSATIAPSPLVAELIEAHTRHFRGRDEEIKRIQEWLSDSSAYGILAITGEPGSGKTALAAKLTREIPLVAVYFTMPRQPVTLWPRQFVRSIATQLLHHETIGPHFARAQSKVANVALGGTAWTRDFQALIAAVHDIIETELNDAPSAVEPFENIVLQPLLLAEELSEYPAVVILVDGFDRLPEGERARMFSLIQQQRTNRMRWILTGDSHSSIGFEPMVGVQLSAPPVDVLGPGVASNFRSGDRTPRQALEGASRREPRGGDSVVNLIPVLLAARDPLTVEQLARFTGAPPEAVRATCEAKAPAITRIGDEPESPHTRYRLHFGLEPSDREGSRFPITAVLDAHWLLSDHYLNQYRERWRECDEYGLRHLVAHLACIGRVEELEALARDPDWLQAKLAATSAAELAADVELIASLVSAREQENPTESTAAAPPPEVSGFKGEMPPME